MSASNFISLQVLPDLYLGNFKGVSECISIFNHSWFGSCFLTAHTHSLSICFLSDARDREQLARNNITHILSIHDSAAPILQVNTFATIISCISNFLNIYIYITDLIGRGPSYYIAHDLNCDTVNEPVCQVDQEEVSYCFNNRTRVNKQYAHVIVLKKKKKPVNNSWLSQCAELCACVGLRVGGCSCLSQCGLCSLTSL